MLKNLSRGLMAGVAFAASAEAQGMNTNLTHVISQDPANVFNFICKTLEGIHKQSVSLVCGIAQLFIVRTFHGDDEQRWPAVKTRDWLKAQLNERGLKQAMVYRYIATGQELARLIQKKYIWGGVMHSILSAGTDKEGNPVEGGESKAFNIIHRCVMEHDYLTGKPVLDWLLDGDSKPRFSLDVLRVNLGLDKLDETKQPGYVAPQAQPVTNATPGSNPIVAVIPPAPATKAAPASIVSRVTADPDALKGISAGALAVAIDKVIGREVMAERIISLCTLDECLKLQAVLNTRMQTLADAPKEPEAVPTDVPAEPAKEPVAEPAEPVVETASKRQRTRRNRAA